MSQLQKMTVLMTYEARRVWAWNDGDWAIARHGLDPRMWLIIHAKSGIVCTFCRRQNVAQALSILRAIRVNDVPIGRLSGCELVDVAPVVNQQFCVMAKIVDPQQHSVSERQKIFAAQVCTHREAQP